MKKIAISNFAAIEHLEMTLDKNMSVIIGAQASGKSTVAKLIYFCRKVKDYMLDFLTEPTISRIFILMSIILIS